MSDDAHWKFLAAQQRKTIARMQKQLAAMSRLNGALADLEPAPAQSSSVLRALRRAVGICQELGLQGDLPSALRCLPGAPPPLSESRSIKKHEAIETARRMTPDDVPDRRKTLVNAARSLMGLRALGKVPTTGRWHNHV